MNQITPQYHAVPTTPVNGTRIHVNNNSISATSDDAENLYGFGIQKYGSTIIILLPPYSNSFFNSKSIYGPPITLTYDNGSSSYSGVPSTL